MPLARENTTIKQLQSKQKHISNRSITPKTQDEPFDDTRFTLRALVEPNQTILKGISTKSYVFYVSAHLIDQVALFIPRVVCTRAEFHNFDSESK